MTPLREAAKEALEALLTPSGAQACSTCQNGPENEYCCRMEMWSAVDALRAALAQQDEPVQEPVAWMCSSPELMAKGYKRFSSWCEGDWNIPVYAAPPQRKPLTDEEILKAIGWERAEMYMKLTPNFPIEEARKETIKNARAIERAHGIKE